MNPKTYAPCLHCGRSDRPTMALKPHRWAWEVKVLCGPCLAAPDHIYYACHGVIADSPVRPPSPDVS
jgi:hypothetical protein